MADIILIIVLIIFAATGANRGLIKTLVGMTSTALSLVLSMILYSPISKALYESSFGDSVKEYVGELLMERAEGAAKLLVTDVTISAASTLAMNVIAFLIVIFVAKFGITFVSKILNVAAKFPVIKQANKLLGMVVGFVSGLLVCYIVAGVIKPISAEGNLLIIKESIEDSLLAINLYSNNIVADLLMQFMK